eukprot:gene21436-27467_t
MVRAGNLPSASVCPTAIDAYHKSTIISTTISKAPAGAFHYWSIGSAGHVAMSMGSSKAFMASCHVTDSWGDCIGSSTVAAYTSATGAKYLGWAYDYAKAEISDVKKLSTEEVVLAAADDVVTDSNQADLEWLLENNVNSSSSTRDYAGALNYAKTTPKRDGGSWNGWCGALMVRAGNLPSGSVCPTAIDAYHKSTIISTTATSAPPGAFHYWSIGSAGHVAMSMGSGKAFMASCHITDSWGDCIGSNTVSGYSSTTGAKYLGWAYDYAKAEISDVRKPNPPGPTPTPSGLPRTTCEENGIPGTNYYARQQYWASKYGYTGPINGVLGVNSWIGTQKGLVQYGYTGPQNGIPGVNTYMAMQRLASKYGYTGPVNGVLGENSYKGLAKYFNTL